MGKRGPRSMPSQLRLVTGSHLERLNPDEPVPEDGELECPSVASPAIRAVWDDTVARLEEMKLAFPADRDALFCYCAAVVTHRDATQLISRSAILVEGVHGNLVRNPALQVARDAAAQVRAFAQEFGLTPSARSSIQAGKPTGDDVDNPYAGTGT